VSLEGFWTNFLQDGSKLNWVPFWLEVMQAKDTMATNWSASDIPSQGKQHSRPDDNFKSCYPGQNASLMRCVGATLPVKGVPMVSEAKVKKFQAIFERTNVLIRIKVVTRSFGTPYSDSVQAEECWDIMALSEAANEVAVR
jgi:hypothetical protein